MSRSRRPKTLQFDHTANVARRAIQALLSGEAPEGATAETCGEWWPMIRAAQQVHAQAGTEEVIHLLTRLAQGLPEVAGLLGSTVGQPASTEPATVPPLPDAARAIYAHLAPCATWLDEYTRFASSAAPMTPRSFHEAAGLFMASVAIARRLVFRAGMSATYPNLFILEIAPPAVFKKTTGLKVMSRLLDAAGLTHLLLPHSVTPQSLTQELSTVVTPDVESYDEATHDEWLQARPFAAQRGWVLDEASGLFDSFTHEYNSGLHLLVLRLYDCAERLTERTASRGRVAIRRAYLSIFGATTPGTIGKHLGNDALWSSGLWSRFAFVTPESRPVYQPQPGKMEIPDALVEGLRNVSDLFPAPHARLKYLEQRDDGGKSRERPVVAVANLQEPAEIVLAPGVEAALDRYGKAVGFDLLVQTRIEPTLHSAYDRLGMQALKVAMVLAALDARALPVRMEARHVARAQQIVEGWRASLHRVWEEDATTEETQLAERILQQLGKARPYGCTARELCQALHRSSPEIKGALEVLRHDERVVQVAAGKRVVWMQVDED